MKTVVSQDERLKRFVIFLEISGQKSLAVVGGEEMMVGRSPQRIRWRIDRTD